jgi:conjugative relaxase-like TrwC/TraI family protein
MIRMFQSQTSAQAKTYFAAALSRADYYLEDQEMNGQYHGKIAARLGLEGQMVDKSSFDQLCDNINPKTGENLTPRTVADRRVGYDISFHCPKSVSIVHALSNDQRILKTFEDSVQTTMKEMEVDMQTRIRTQGQYDDRKTGEILWTNFTHQTARPVDGHPPDPHLHCHCFTFNVTYDKTEDRYKAGQFFTLKRDMPYYQARFQKRLADALSDQGYDIRKTKNGFELAVVPQAAIDHFSKRTNLIGQVAKEKGITNPKNLDQLGSRTRAKKQKNLTMPELRQKWGEQLEDNHIGDKAKSEVKTTDKTHSPKQAIDHAIIHEFTRHSVRRDRQILAQAYLHAIDNDAITLDKIDHALESNEEIFKIRVGSQRLCTTQAVHAQEREMINRARGGIGTLRPLHHHYDPTKHDHLSLEQHNVMRHVLTSGDRLTMIRGGAGTGKTTLLKTIIPAIEKTGKKVHLYAPTAQASRGVLKAEGFNHAETVAKLLKDKKLQDQLKGQVIWVDESGMLGVQDTNAILKLAEEQ